MAHIHEKIDFTVDVFIVYNGRVLVRKHDKYDEWLGVGGHVELDEDPNQAAVREAKEETGLDVELIGEATLFGRQDDLYKELIPPRYMNIHNVTPTHQHIGLIYFATANSDEVIDEGREKSGGCKWFTKEELKKNEEALSETIRFYATKALQTSDSM